MGDWIIVPVVLPALLAPLIVLVARFDLVLQRVLSMTGTVALLAVALMLWHASASGPEAYLLGDWPAPFGIVLVLDRLSAMMLVLTALLAAAVLLHAMGGFDARGRHFHALFQFQLMGLNGAFLTGDVFNLFVFFEVLLIASYGLMLHGAKERALRAGLQYIAINLAGSTLFLFAVGLIYGVTGTLNMADLAVKVPLVAESDRALLHVGGLLLLAVFALKAALVPLHFWLPGTYAAAGVPVAALFAIMTKVGAYAILRIYTLVFGAEAGGSEAWLAAPWLLPAGLVTVVLGAAGVLGARNLRDQTCYAVIGSMGTLLIAIGLLSPQGTAAALFYLISSTLAGATLFLVADLLGGGRGGPGDDSIRPLPAIRGQEVVAGLFMLAALLMAGMPPLSGFLGKLLILAAAGPSPWMSWVWAVILTTSLVVIIGFARTGSAVFWKSVTAGEGGGGPPLPATGVAATGLLLAAAAALTLLAGPADAVFQSMAADLHAPRAYIEAVLGPSAVVAGPVP
jgi:multicomponent K+:H+ antiporter subunit D